jgi:hypothetical protein
VSLGDQFNKPVHRILMSAFGTKADVQTALMNVRFEGKIGRDAGVTPLPLMTQSGLSGSAQAREALTTFGGDDDNLAR